MFLCYCRSGNIREVLFFANFAKMTNSRIQESHQKYYYNNSYKEKSKFANSKLREKSQNQKFAKITRCTVFILTVTSRYRRLLDPLPYGPPGTQDLEQTLV